MKKMKYEILSASAIKRVEEDLGATAQYIEISVPTSLKIEGVVDYKKKTTYISYEDAVKILNIEFNK